MAMKAATDATPLRALAHEEASGGDFGEPLLTARQVADLLALSPHTVLDWFERGELPGVKLNGRAVRFVPSEVRAWVEGQR